MKIGAMWWPLFGAILISPVLVTSAEETKVDTRKAIGDLRSDDRLARFKAAQDLAREKTLPATLADPAIAFIKSEISLSFVPEVLPGRATVKANTIPIDPDAVTTTRLKAQPEKYIGSDFVLIGLLEVGDYYNFGFSNESDDYFSLSFQPVNQQGGENGESATLYLSKFVGKSLVEQLTRIAEKGGGGRLVARLRCTIDPWRCQQPEHAIDSIRVTDWHFLTKDGKAWMPGAYEGVDLGFDILLSTGANANQKCVDLITAESVFQNEDADKILRSWAVMRILKLSKVQRQMILRWLPNRVKRAKSARAKIWGTRAYDSLLLGRLSY